VKYQLPQFIETEVKLIGPFTLKQFLWIAGGAAILFVSFITLPPLFFFIIAIPVAAASLAFAFIKIQGMPLINYLAFMLAYTLNPKKYLFRNEDPAQNPYVQDRITIK
jgi:hypothetical protein